MRKIVCVAIGVISICGLCSATPACTDGTLSSYIALGSGGCTIGNNTLSDFAVLSGITGATAISALDVSLTPLGGAADPGLTSTISVTAGAGNILESLFTFKISGSSYIGSSISLANSSESGDGAVTGLENFCAGGAFGPDGVSGCTGLPGSLATLDGIQNSDGTPFSASSFLTVTDDFTVDGGLSGSASGGTFTGRFSTTSATPEPISLLLTGLGLSLAVRVSARRAGAQRVSKLKESSTSCKE